MSVRSIAKGILVAGLLGLVLAVAGSEARAEKITSLITVAPSEERALAQGRVPGWILADPQSVDLHIPPSIFRDFFAAHPPLQVPASKRADFIDHGTCHTQGLAIVKGRIVISCCFYDNRLKHTRLYAGQSLLLSAKFSDVVHHKEGRPIDWRVRDITALVPSDQAARIKSIADKFNGRKHVKELERYRLELSPGTTPEQAPLSPVMSHPSGLAVDSHGRVWVANAVYGGPGSYSTIAAYDPKTLKDAKGTKRFSLPYHIGWLAIFDHRFLVGETWGGLLLAVIDMKTGERSVLPNPNRDQPGVWTELTHVGFDDCTGVGKEIAICGGAWFHNGYGSGRMVRSGRLYLLRGSGKTLKDFRFKALYPLWIQLRAHPPSSPTFHFGERIYTYREGLGDRDERMNEYGDEKMPIPLTNNGITLGPKKRSIYFLPNDLPGAKLIRYRFKRHTQ